MPRHDRDQVSRDLTRVHCDGCRCENRAKDGPQCRYDGYVMSVYDRTWDESRLTKCDTKVVICDNILGNNRGNDFASANRPAGKKGEDYSF